MTPPTRSATAQIGAHLRLQPLVTARWRRAGGRHVTKSAHVVDTEPSYYAHEFGQLPYQANASSQSCVKPWDRSAQRMVMN
jgi:hypothetical protein